MNACKLWRVVYICQNLWKNAITSDKNSLDEIAITSDKNSLDEIGLVIFISGSSKQNNHM